MKTADLIPLILLELNESDKYGFELTKNIETKSNGHIVIKQPTLYTVLKKLEKSKFISSYWQDSEIGGKRHYYTLTANGRMQVSTLPNYETLLGNLNTEAEASDDFMLPMHESSIHEEPTKISMMDAILDEKQEPIESIISTEELFSSEMIDNSTEMDLNLSNTEILKDEQTNHNENFATNEDVATFTQKINTDLPTEFPTQFNASEKTNIFEIPNFEVAKTDDSVKFVDYVDFKKDETYINAKKTAKHMLFRTLCTSTYLAIMLIICAVITNFTGKSSLYNFSLIASLAIILFNPLIYIWFYQKFETKCREKGYKHNFKQHLIISISLFLLILLAIIVINISVGKNTFSSMFSSANFANLLAPLLLTTTIFADLIFAHSFLTKLNK